MLVQSRVRKIPWRRKLQPIPVFLSGKFHRQRSLAGYSPRGRKESDMTEQLSMPTGEEIPGEKYFHHIISRAHNINMTVLICWHWPQSPGWPSVSGFSTVKLFFLPRFCPLKKEVTMHYPQGKSPFILLLVLFFSQTQSLNIFFVSSTSLLLPTHLPPPRAHMLSHVIPWTSARQILLSMDFSRQEYWSGLPFPSPKASVFWIIIP